ncbi:hypothetical protein GCM10009786_19110 [Leucobacter alluvii]|uniref:Solute-binding protein family 3/N-terminal domain-containing protein n=1 Tax=Leucobacter alluvii TaxID=340321 RepID=A0ABP5N242_9MICO
MRNRKSHRSVRAIRTSDSVLPVQAGVVAALLVALTGCGITIPSDPDDTLGHAIGAELRIGIAVEPPLSEDGDPPRGPLPELAIEYAETLDASPVWSIGSEETLVEMLEQEKLDVALGNFSPDSPWSERAALSRPFTVDGADPAELVALMPLGENAMLSNFETFIDSTERAQ